MSEKTKAVWQDLPDLIFRETMMLLNLEELPKCRQVCKIWNAMISQMTKNKKNTIWRKAESLATQIGYKMDRSYKPHLAEILPLASMAHHGIPISVKQMFIHEDLASVPVKHLASLVSCVTSTVFMQDVNCDVVPILLDNIKCKYVSINQTLGSEGTKSLVRAMESNVEIIFLGTKLNLDIAVLNQYSGEGKCRSMGYYHYEGNSKVIEEIWRRRYTTWSSAIKRIDIISKLSLLL